MRKMTHCIVLLLAGNLILSCQSLPKETPKIGGYNLELLETPTFIHTVHKKQKVTKKGVVIKMTKAEFAEVMNKAFDTSSAVLDYQTFLYLNDVISFETLERTVRFQTKYDIYYSTEFTKEENAFKAYQAKMKAFLEKIRKLKK